MSWKIHPEASTRSKNIAPVFFERVTEKFSGRFDYSKSVYKSAKTPMTITCKEHGDFIETPNNHENAHHSGGCKQCKLLSKRKSLAMHGDEYKQRAKIVHGDAYDYSRTNYVNAETNIAVHCKHHGDFEINPMNHLKGYGCQSCAGYAGSEQSFITKAEKIHGDTYDYSKVNWSSSTIPVEILCPVHGPFMQTPADHINKGAKCPKCAGVFVTDTETFIARAQERHGDKFDYSLVDYNRHDTPVKIICPTHGVFSQTPSAHLDKRSAGGCGGCNSVGISRGETEVAQMVEHLLNGSSKVIRNIKNIIPPYELDVYIPDAKLAIEYCGVYWHSDTVLMNKFSSGKYAHLSLAQQRKLSRWYHHEKFKRCELAGIRLLTIFEDEWINRRSVIQSIVGHALGVSKTGVGGRKLVVKRIETTVAKPFLNTYHPQGHVACSVYLGAYEGDTLRGVMAFGTPTRQNSKGTELKRFAADGVSYPGMAGKLFKHYTKNYNPDRVISFSDNRWFTGGMYKQLGFYIEAELPPDYSYIHVHTMSRKHKSVYRKSGIKKHFPEYYNEDLTEQVMMEQVPNMERTFDCGKRRWVWIPNGRP